MKRRNKEPVKPYQIGYQGGGNVCPPPLPRATDEELDESADKVAGLLDKAFDLLDQASAFLVTPVQDTLHNKRSNYAGHYPRFPNCGPALRDALNDAKVNIVDAHKLVAVQGYAAKRRKADEK